jgi:hypothetical protein
MTLRDVARENPRLGAVANDVVSSFTDYVTAEPNSRIHWVEEYARAQIHGTTHRAGLVAITNSAVVLAWKHGLLYRRRSHFVLRRAEVGEWSQTDDRLIAATAGGPVVIEFRAGSAEWLAFSERLRLIRPLGDPTSS